MDISSAIKNHNYIEFLYEGHHRKVIPYAYGDHATTRNKVMRGLQVAGTSASGKFDFPKLFEVEKMTNFNVLAEQFAEIPVGYRKGDEHIAPMTDEL
jgi:hypothetical protein